MIKEILRKNKKLFNILKKINKYRTIAQVYIYKLFNPIRLSSCDKNSIRCEYDIRNRNYKYTLLGDNTPICCLTHLYEITRDITIVLNKEDIDYFIMYGTLLGQVRHNQTFIPWDTDVDIVVMKKDRLKVEELLSSELSSSYDIVKSEKIMKINYSKSNQLHADIYFWEEQDDILIDTLNDYWIKNRVQKSDVFPLKSSKLYNLDVEVPKNKEQVLKDTYGDDCLEKAFKKYASKKEIIRTFNEGKIDKRYMEVDK